jgi:hypothetical protein
LIGHRDDDSVRFLRVVDLFDVRRAIEFLSFGKLKTAKNGFHQFFTYLMEQISVAAYA